MSCAHVTSITTLQAATKGLTKTPDVSLGNEWNVGTTKWHCKPLGPSNKSPAMASYESLVQCRHGTNKLFTHSSLSILFQSCYKFTESSYFKGNN